MKPFHPGRRIRGRAAAGCLVAAVLLMVPIFASAVRGPQKSRDSTVVTAVEVPVRVFRKNEIVKGLAKEDFEIYEGGVRQEISGFEIVSRKIAPPGPESPAAAVVRAEPRLFILIFDIFDYNDSIGQAVDYFFETIFRESDQLVVLTEDRLLNVDAGKTRDSVRASLKEMLKRYKVISTQRSHKAYLDLEEECDRLLQELGDDLQGTGASSGWDQSISHFYDYYAAVWKAYREQFLVPDIGAYQALITKVRPVRADKWALCFQQREIFPELKSQGRLDRRINMILDSQVDPGEQAKARLVKDKQRRLAESFEVSKDFPSERLRDLFLEAGITFDLILMNVPRSLLSQDLEFKEVSQDYEACLRDISRSTGGSLALSNKVLDALQEAAGKEDYHYLLAYQSRAPLEKRGKDIEVKVRREGVAVYILNQFPKSSVPGIMIAEFQAGRKTLRFGLRNYLRQRTDAGTRGAAEVRVTLFNSQSERVFSEGKVMDLIKEETWITLNLENLAPGPYLLIIEAQDRMTNEKDVYSRMIEI